MDYKLIRRMTAVCSLSVLAILVIVLWSNRFGGFGKDAHTSAGPGKGTASDGPDAPGTGSAWGQGDDAGEYLSIGDLRAFLRDEDFWDEEPDRPQVQTGSAMRLSLIATSVQRDLRLQIVDPDGKLVTGQPFFVKIEDVGEFKDLDQDGVIYVRELSAGDYQVSVLPIEGYHVSATYTHVHVNDKVEYRAIADIGLLIVSEDEIDAGRDALQERDLAQDRDATEHTGSFEGLDKAVMGIDVSSHNGEIDWERVKEAGIEFAMIRCGFRGYSSGSLVEDARFLQNISAANDAGIPVGIYFFTQAVNEVEAVEEASMVITLCRDYQVDLPVFIDTEGVGGGGRADALDTDTRTLVCRAFCETMEHAGYRTGVYASKNWILGRLDYSRLTKYLTWLAEYKEQATYEGEYQFWQYTSNGWIDGVTGRVDLNIGNLSLSDLGAVWRGDDKTGPVPEAEGAEEARGDAVPPETGT